MEVPVLRGSVRRHLATRGGEPELPGPDSAAAPSGSRGEREAPSVGLWAASVGDIHRLHQDAGARGRLVDDAHRQVDDAFGRRRGADTPVLGPQDLAVVEDSLQRTCSGGSLGFGDHVDERGACEGVEWPADEVCPSPG